MECPGDGSGDRKVSGVARANPGERSDSSSRNLIRLGLGIAQMVGGVTALVLLAETGVNTASMGAVVVTCLLTTTSVLLFGSRRERP